MIAKFTLREPGIDRDILDDQQKRESVLFLDLTDQQDWVVKQYHSKVFEGGKGDVGRYDCLNWIYMNAICMRVRNRTVPQ